MKDVTGIPRIGKDLIIVAAVDNVLHFRILDGAGKTIVDTDEKRLTAQAPQIEDLKTQLVGLWPAHELTESDKGRVISTVTSIVGYARPKGAEPVQMLASMVKVPLLFYLTLLVTFRRCTFQCAGWLAADAVDGHPAARGESGRDRDRAGIARPDRGILLGQHDELPVHVAVQCRGLCVSGVLGLTFLLQTLHRLSVARCAAAGCRHAIDRGASEIGPSPRPARPAREPGLERARQDGLPALGDRVWAGRGPDGLGPAPVHRQPEHAVHLVPRPGVEFLPGGLPDVREFVLLTGVAGPAP